MSDEEGTSPDVFAQHAQTPAAAAAAATAPAYTGENSYVRDKDPPPGYDGVDPETTFRSYEKSVRLWQFETDVPAKKQGAKLMRALSGIARMAVEEMEFEDIATENGAKNLLTRLREFFNPHLEVSMPRAFEAAVYGQARQSKETFVEYVARMERAFIRLEKEGVHLPNNAQGYILYRHASLSEGQEQRVQTWTEGKYGKSEVVSSLRKLDKVLKEKGKSHYLVDEYNVVDGSYHQEVVEDDEDDEDGDYIYITEGDLNTIMEEDAVMEALASYREVRQALKDQKTNRGFYPGRGQGKGFGKGKGKQRVHVEQLKLRTKCNRCHAIGHWARECTQPRPQNHQSSSSSTATGVPPVCGTCSWVCSCAAASVP